MTSNAQQLAAEELAADPRIGQARRLMLEAVAEHQQKLAPRGPLASRALAYAAALDEFAAIRGGTLYYPYLGSGLGRGPLVELSDGSVKYDMISGIGVHYLGHGHPALLAAAFDAAMQDVIMQGNLEQNSQSVDLARVLVQLAGKNGARLAHCFFSTSGAMANENALKIILQKKSPAARMLAFEHAFAGRTLALAQITDKAAYREGLPEVLEVDYVPFFDSADPTGSHQRAVATLQAHLARHPGKHAAMCMELILGEGGYYAGDRAFFMALIDVLKAAGILVWIDEVQTFGRTSEPFAFQSFGLGSAIDVATIGKLTQVCATFFTDTLKPRPGLISQTFTGSTSALFAARAIIDEMLAGHFFGPAGRIAHVHEQFAGRFQQIAQAHPGWLRGPHGMGAMIAFTPFDGSDAVAKTLLQALFQAGVIAFVAGSAPARVRFLPPVGAMSDEDVTTVCRILENTLAAVAAGRSEAK